MELTEVILSLEEVSKRFGGVTAVHRLSLTILKGELFTLLGPSGCGKTTTLRIIAGLERPDEGRIVCKQQTFVSVSDRIFAQPEKRRIGMVFQSLALWPHMTVFENVAYPLRIRRMSSQPVKERVNGMLRVVGLEGFANRLAPTLSGGQQQRVALARALVYQPDILLMDEPFSSLDPALRRQMNAEIRALREKLGLSLIFVTHDQGEAFSVSDRIAVMNHGSVEQVGTPRDLYQHPGSAFVRDFLGKTLTLRGTIRAFEGNHVSIELQRAGGVVVGCDFNGVSGVSVGSEVDVSIRPEDLSVIETAGISANNTLQGTIERVSFAGDRFEAEVRVGEERLIVYLPGNRPVKPGEMIWLRFPSDGITLWQK